jgi:hypothetical protein
MARSFGSILWLDPRSMGGCPLELALDWAFNLDAF